MNSRSTSLGENQNMAQAQGINKLTFHSAFESDNMISSNFLPEIDPF